MESTQKNGVWGPWPTVGWGVLTFAVWLLAQGAAFLGIWALCLFENGGKETAGLMQSLADNGLVISFSTIFGGLAGFGSIWLAIASRKGPGVREYLGLHPLKRETLFKVLGASALFCLAQDLLSYSLGKDIIAKFMVDSFSTRGDLGILILGISLAGSLFEETFFRGFLFGGLARSRLGAVGAALLTTAAWAFLHIQYDIYQVSIVFAGGLALVYLRLKTGSLWSSIILHVLMNTWGILEVALYFHGFTFLYSGKG